MADKLRKKSGARCCGRWVLSQTTTLRASHAIGTLFELPLVLGLVELAHHAII
jgi:hypothetical protein